MALVLRYLYQTMKKFSAIKNATLALGLLMLLGGCQGALRTNSAAVPLDNAGFMTVWDAYRHCQAGTNVDTMRAEMQQLARAASAQESAAALPVSLPDFVKHMVAKPAQRLAADPKAMTAACALSTGQAALRAERMELATEMFQSVLRNHSQPDYAYYVDQARTGLAQVDRAVQFAGYLTDATPVVIPVSSASSAPETARLHSSKTNPVQRSARRR